MAMYYKDKGKTLPEALEDLFKKYGRYEEKSIAFSFGGADPQGKMHEVMQSLRNNTPDSVAGLKIVRVGDMLSGLYTDKKTGGTEPTNLPNSDVLHFTFEDGSVVAIRPSGTEPKVRVYMMVRRTNHKECAAAIDAFEKEFRGILQ